MIDGTYEIETTAKRSQGEAGLDHLTGPLTGIRFESTPRAKSFAADLLTEYGYQGAHFPIIKVNARFGKRVQGRYTPAKNQIEIAPHLRLRTLVHELAHWLTHVQHGKGGHCPQFKRVFKALLAHTYQKLGKPIPRAPARTIRGQEMLAMPPAGTEVIVQDRNRCFVGKVIKRNRVRCKVQDESGSVWNVPASMMTWDK